MCVSYGKSIQMIIRKGCVCVTLNMANNELYICYSIDELKQKGIDVKNILIAGKIEELARDLIKEYSHDSIVQYNCEHAALLNGKLICSVSKVDELDYILSKHVDDDISILETAIKFYNVNKDGNLLSLQNDENEFIPIFSAIKG